MLVRAAAHHGYRANDLTWLGLAELLAIIEQPKADSKSRTETPTTFTI